MCVGCIYVDTLIYIFHKSVYQHRYCLHTYVSKYEYVCVCKCMSTNGNICTNIMWGGYGGTMGVDMYGCVPISRFTCTGICVYI